MWYVWRIISRTQVNTIWDRKLQLYKYYFTIQYSNCTRLQAASLLKAQDATYCYRSTVVCVCLSVCLFQSCPWVGLTHGLDWVGSTIATVLKIWKDYVNAFEARLDKIWLYQAVIYLLAVLGCQSVDGLCQCFFCKRIFSGTVIRWQSM